mgnify:CR=1 FL=1
MEDYLWLFYYWIEVVMWAWKRGEEIGEGGEGEGRKGGERGKAKFIMHLSSCLWQFRFAFLTSPLPLSFVFRIAERRLVTRLRSRKKEYKHSIMERSPLSPSRHTKVLNIEPKIVILTKWYLRILLMSLRILQIRLYIDDSHIRFLIISTL